MSGEEKEIGTKSKKISSTLTYVYESFDNVSKSTKMHVLVHILLFSHIRSLHQEVQKILFLISGAGIPPEH